MVNVFFLHSPHFTFFPFSSILWIIFVFKCLMNYIPQRPEIRPYKILDQPHFFSCGLCMLCMLWCFIWRCQTLFNQFDTLNSHWWDKNLLARDYHLKFLEFGWTNAYAQQTHMCTQNINTLPIVIPIIVGCYILYVMCINIAHATIKTR